MEGIEILSQSEPLQEEAIKSTESFVMKNISKIKKAVSRNAESKKDAEALTDKTKTMFQKLRNGEYGNLKDAILAIKDEWLAFEKKHTKYIVSYHPSINRTVNIPRVSLVGSIVTSLIVLATVVGITTNYHLHPKKNNIKHKKIHK